MKKFLISFLLFSCKNFVFSKEVIPTSWEHFLQNPTYLPCASTLFKNDSDTTELVHAKKASFASGKILESLDLISLTFCKNIESKDSCEIRENRTMNDFKKCLLERETNISQCSQEYPYLSSESSMTDKLPFLSSLGLHDTCNEIPGYYYCSILVMNQTIWSYGICVPDTCSVEEIKESIKNIMIYQGYINASVHRNELFSSTCGDYVYSWTTGTTVMVCICGFLIFLLSIGTLLDIMNYHSRKRIVSVCKCFSLKRNINFLLQPPRNGCFDCFDGIRTFSILWIIFGHTFVFKMMGLTFTNLEDIIGNNNQGWITTYPAQALTSAYFAVDTFFFMSGFLAMFFLMEMSNKFVSRGDVYSYCKQIPFLYIKRFLRLTPTYFFILFFYIKILPQLESGPFWNLLEKDIEFCNKYWWTNLLYMNNLYPSDSSGCYAVTWYLANDFQFFLMVPFFALFAVYSVKNYTHLLSIVILLIGCTISIVFAFIESYKNNWSINIYDATFLSGYFPNYYTKPWFRCPPYLFGMILAIIWYYYFDEKNSPFLQIKNELEIQLIGYGTERKTRIYKNFIKKNNLLKNVLFLLSLSIFGFLVLGEKGAYSNIPSDWSDTEMSFYISFSKPLWSIGLCILSFLLFLKEFSWIHQILSNHFISVISKLTFCMYLIHPTILYWYYLSQDYPTHFNDSWYSLTYLSIVFASILLSIVVYLSVEKPISNVEKMFL